MDIRRADDRFVTEYDGVVSRHSFSFGVHYDPLNIGFGMLVSHNEDTLEPTTGYAEHPHRDLEIVTYVLEGELRHRDTAGHAGVIVPGQVQVMGAGSGVLHEEHAGPGLTRFVQMWVRPDETGLPPAYRTEVVDLDGWQTVAVRSSRAVLHTTRLGTTTLPTAPRVHLFVARGTATLETGEVLRAGDTARITDCEGPRISGDAEVLAWAMR